MQDPADCTRRFARIVIDGWILQSTEAVADEPCHGRTSGAALYIFAIWYSKETYTLFKSLLT